VYTLGIYHRKALCALLFVSPKHFLNLVVHRLDYQAKGDGVVRPFARAALNRDGPPRFILELAQIKYLCSGRDSKDARL
jgi:hypothetical protein